MLGDSNKVPQLRSVYFLLQVSVNLILSYKMYCTIVIAGPKVNPKGSTLCNKGFECVDLIKIFRF